jgi:hypothetical protein
MRGALFISWGLLFLSTISIILVLIAGANKHVLMDLFFLKGNITFRDPSFARADDDIDKHCRIISSVQFGQLNLPARYFKDQRY